jgi:hypothetical protein
VEPAKWSIIGRCVVGRSREVVAKVKKRRPFDVKTFLSTVDGGRTVATYQKNQKVFSQGDPADSVFYIQEGQVKVCVISEEGKEAVSPSMETGTSSARAA